MAEPVEHSSIYRGVGWHKGDRKWRVKIRHGQRHYYLGNYEREEDAARVYDVAALALFRGRARLNFDGQPPAGISQAAILTRLYTPPKPPVLPWTHLQRQKSAENRVG